MALIRSAFALRSKDHVATRLQLREERANRRILFSYIGPLYAGFSLVDWVSTTGTSLWYFFSLRVGVVVAARIFYVASRGRVAPSLRIATTIFSYVFAIEYLMIRYDLVGTPYFAGMSLVMLA